MLNLKNKPVVVIGGGYVAWRKVKDLIEAGAVINIIAPEFDAEIVDFARENSNRIELTRKQYSKEDLEGTVLVFSTTNDPAVNKQIFIDCSEKNIFLNAADDPEFCSFQLPSSFKKGDLTVAVSTAGASPALAAKLREDFEKDIPVDIDLKLQALKYTRKLLKEDPAFSDFDSSRRGAFLKKITRDEEMLNNLIARFRKNELKEFILSISIL